MEIPPLPHKIDAADMPLERLADNPHLSESQKLAEVSRQFEAILLRQVLQQAEQPVFQSGANPDSSASSIYRDLVVNQLADSISRSGTLGLAASLNQQMIRQVLPAKAAPATAEAKL